MAISGSYSVVYSWNYEGTKAWVKFTCKLSGYSEKLYVIARRSGTTTWITQGLYAYEDTTTTRYETFTPPDGTEFSRYIWLGSGFTSDYQFSLAAESAPTTPLSGVTTFTYKHPAGKISDAGVYTETPETNFPYNGTAKITVSSLTQVITGSTDEKKWRLVVGGVTKASFTSGGDKPIELAYLFDGEDASYTVELWPPRSLSYIATCTVDHQGGSTEDESVTEPNVTSLSITDVSYDGFTVSATQNNLTAGSWGFELSKNSSFASIADTSSEALAATKNHSYEFSGLDANTTYYIRVFNILNDDRAYATGWSRRTGIVPFSWAKTPGTNMIPSEAITKAKWDLLQTKISQVSVRNGDGSVSLAAVTQGARITAKAFNDVATAISNLDGAGSVPSQKNPGDAMKAADFEGSSGLKGAINRAIAALND